LAAYGVKEGGIGSLMASGFPMLKRTGTKAEPSNEQGAVCIPDRESSPE
jgi:hypothetical protein